MGIQSRREHFVPERQEGDMGFTRFMASATGRALRALVGVALLIIGFAFGGAWIALSVVGLLFVAVGVFDVCLLAPLFGRPISGKANRG
jgi:hypothetical protein